ncbi:MAG: hypothetical protein VCE74_22530 [Alphaproteobacteria bacterium]
MPPEEFGEEIRAAADALIVQHGAEVENATTEKMIEVLDNGSLDEVLHWLKVRQCVRQTSGQDRYVRRLPDKIFWAVEQGRSHLARLLGAIYSEAKSDEDRSRGERRKEP